MKAFKNWLGRFKSQERRKAERVLNPNLAAYYWDGDKPKAHTVRDISLTGLYLVTEERWYPRTLVRMTLQKVDVAEDDMERTIAIESMVVRWGSDGVGLTFLPPDGNESGGGQNRLANGADKKTLEKFIRQVTSEQVRAFVESVVVAS
jgi:hypothetical protein